MILNSIFRSLKAAATAMVAVAALSACTETEFEFTDPEITESAGKIYRTGFYLSAGKLSGTSRTTPAGDYDPGLGIENFIDLDNSNIRVLLYDLSDKFLTEITELQFVQVQENESGKVYYISGQTKTDISSGKFKVMVLANWPSYPSEPAPEMDRFFDCRFSFDGSLPTAERPIPMYGIKEVNLSGISEGIMADLGTIHLIRAMAKIEVIFDNPDNYWTISKLQLTHYNTSGFCAPAVKNQDDYVKDNWNNDYLSEPFIPDDVQSANDLNFVDRGNGHYILYVPEYKNSNVEAAKRARLCIDFKESSLGEHFVDLIDTSRADSPVADIMRNIWYKITVRKTKETSDIEISVDVIPYAVRELDPIFGL